MPEKIESWLGKHLVTTLISLCMSGMMAFSAIAYGFSQTTIATEATLKQQIVVMDTRLSQYMDTTDDKLSTIGDDTKWLKDNLYKVIVSTAVLESKDKQ